MKSPHEQMTALDQAGDSYQVTISREGWSQSYAFNVFHHSDEWLAVAQEGDSVPVWHNMRYIQSIRIVLA